MISAALICLASVVYHEARGEPIEGQYAVAQVVLNRARRNPDRVCAEVQRPWQFAWWRQHEQGAGLTGRISRQAWQRAIIVAAGAWHIEDFTSGATHFHADYVRPRWARRMTEVGRWGRHIFYRELPRRRAVK